MKKLIIPEGFGEDADKNVKTPSAAVVNAKTSATKPTQPAVDFPSTISDPLDIANVKARAMKLAPAETEADLIKKWSEPEEEEDDIDPVGKVTGYLKSAIDLIDKYPWLLVFLWKPARGFLWNIGKSSFKKMFPGKVDIASVEKQIFVASNMLQAAFKTGKFKRNMGYLSKGLLERELITPQQYKEFQAEIVTGKLKWSFWRTNVELRKSFKDFAIMCMHTNKISFKQFKQLKSFSPNSAELKAFVQAKVDLAKKMGINNLSLSPEEKLILNPTNLATKSKKTKIRGGRRF
jgi:hypothetical protein